MVSIPNPRWPNDPVQSALTLHDNRLHVAEPLLETCLKRGLRDHESHSTTDRFFFASSRIVSIPSKER